MTLDDIKGRTYSSQEEFWRDVEAVVAAANARVEIFDSEMRFWKLRYDRSCSDLADNRRTIQFYSRLAKQSVSHQAWARRWKALAKEYRKQSQNTFDDLDDYIEASK